MYTFKLASSSLLKIGQETDKTTTRNRESVYLLLDMVSLILIFSDNKEVPAIPDCLFLAFSDKISIRAEVLFLFRVLIPPNRILSKIAKKNDNHLYFIVW